MFDKQQTKYFETKEETEKRVKFFKGVLTSVEEVIEKGEQLPQPDAGTKRILGKVLEDFRNGVVPEQPEPEPPEETQPEGRYVMRGEGRKLLNQINRMQQAENLKKLDQFQSMEDRRKKGRLF